MKFCEMGTTTTVYLCMYSFRTHNLFALLSGSFLLPVPGFPGRAFCCPELCPNWTQLFLPPMRFRQFRAGPCRSFSRHSDPPFMAGHYRYTDGNKCVKHRLTLFNKKFIKIYVANRLPVAYSIDEKEESFSVCRHCNLAFIPDVRAGPLERNRKTLQVFRT